MKAKFKVEVTRIAWRKHVFQVEAETRQDAIDIAERKASDFDFTDEHECDVVYESEIVK